MRDTALGVSNEIPFKELGVYALEMKQLSQLVVCMVCPNLNMKGGKKELVSTVWGIGKEKVILQRPLR